MPPKSFLSEMTKPVLTLAAAGPLDALGLLARIEADTAALRRLVAQAERERVARPATGDPERILMAVEQEFSVSRAALRERPRRASIVWPRQLALWLLRALTPLSTHEIGALMARTHSNVSHACQSVEGVLATDMEKRERVLALLERLTPTLKHARLVMLPATSHPSPALRAPSPLVGRGERDGVRGAPAPAHHCACGRLAVLKKNSSWVCARCDAIESRHFTIEKR